MNLPRIEVNHSKKYVFLSSQYMNRWLICVFPLLKYINQRVKYIFLLKKYIFYSFLQLNLSEPKPIEAVGGMHSFVAQVWQVPNFAAC